MPPTTLSSVFQAPQPNGAPSLYSAPPAAPYNNQVNNMLNAGAVDPNLTGGTTQQTGTYTGGTNTGTNTGTTVDPGWAALYGKTNDLVSQLNGIYNQIYGAVDTGAANQRGTAEQSAADQSNTLQNQYIQNTRNLPWLYAGMGTGQSSFATDAQNDAGNIYNSNQNQIQDSLKSAEQGIGGWDASQKATYLANQQANQNDLSTINGLQTNPSGMYRLSEFYNSLNQQLPTAQGTLAGLQPSGQLLQQLNQYAPSQVNGADQLKQQLQTLQQASVPQFAANQIASGLIKQNDPTQTNYWLNYYNNLGQQTA